MRRGDARYQLLVAELPDNGNPVFTGYERALYLALRRGLLMVEAQSAWLHEVSEFLFGGKRGGKGHN